MPTLLQRLSPTSSEALLPVSLGSADGLRAVTEGRVDLAIVSEWRRDERSEGVALLDVLLEPYVALLPPDHRLGRAHALGPRALRDQSVISAAHSDCGGRLAESGASQRMAASLAHAQGLVARGDGIAVWPACTTPAASVVARPIGDHRVARRLAVAVRADSLHSPVTRRIIEGVADAFRGRPGGRGRYLWRGIPAPPKR